MIQKNTKTAYAPYSKNLSAPGDRRRFIFYAAERKIIFEIAKPNKEYNIVYLTYGCDISIWIDYKRSHPNVKLIFELIDSYLLEETSFLTVFRGSARFIAGKESSLWLNYKTALRKMVSIADAVVCSSLSQREDILPLNKNTHISLDYFSNDITCQKKTWASKGKIKLVWEGQSNTLKNLLVLNPIFEKLSPKIELYVITDKFIMSAFGAIRKPTRRLLEKLRCDFTFIEWEKSTFSEHIANADLAIIPINMADSMARNKPENKLLLFWEIGIPTLTSDTPAYRRTMRMAGLDFYCSNANDWEDKIIKYGAMPLDLRLDTASKAKNYITEFHNKSQNLRKWDSIFDSIDSSLAVECRMIV